LPPATIPFVNRSWILLDVEQDRCPLRQGPKENMPAKEIALSNKLADRKSDTESLSDNLACHLLSICQDELMRSRRSDCILFHDRANELIEC